MPFPINPPGTVLIDESGKATTEFYKFLLNIQKIIGTSGAASLDEVTFLAMMDSGIDAPGTLKVGSGMTGGGNMGGNVDIGLSVATASGIYTPSLTNVANLSASTAYSCQYLKVGNTVTVSGRVDIDPVAAATSTKLGISLPIASNIANSNECAGVAFASGIATQGAAILGDATNDRAQLEYISGDVTNQPMWLQFSYRVQ